MAAKWMKKLWNLMFEDESEIGSKPNIHEPQSKKQSHSSRTIGRIMDTDKKMQAKMVHQYPQEGPFRFPVIPDEKVTEKKQSLKKKQVKEISSSRSVENVPTEKQQEVQSASFNRKEKFAGKNFRAQDIPSPVYGFRGRKQGYEKQNELNFPLPKVVQDLSLNESSADLFVQPIVTDEEKEMLHNYAESRVEVKEEEYDLSEVELKHKNQDEEPAVQEERTAAPMKKNQPEIHYNSEEKKGSNSFIEKKPHPQKTMDLNQAIEYKQRIAAKKDEDKKQQTADQSHAAPYNVMMFKKDRVKSQRNMHYQLPRINLLDIPKRTEGNDQQWLEEQKALLETTLKNFNVDAAVVGVTQGPTVTRYEVQPKPGVKVNKITNLSDDIKLSLSAKDIRIEAPIPGRNAIGIEVPNKVSQPVSLREIIRSGTFQQSESPLTVALGLDISGQPIVTDLQKMPHGLIAGATGSGKSVCINSILASLLLKADPEEVKLLLVDPKVVELAPYNKIPHLVTPVITDVKEATMALKWAVEEMERRYQAFAQTGVRDIGKFNEWVKKNELTNSKMPYIVIVIDELADLMMVSPQDVEDAICRIAQKARACGIHLLVATQRPSVDVITGLIKANIPTRVAFSVSSQIDSRTILDVSGAEKLLGRGDMLFLGNGTSKPVRIQGNFVSDEEIERLTAFVRQQKQPNYLIEKEDLSTQQMLDQEDELFEEACHYVLEQGGASASSLQRRFRIGYNRAARLVDMMESCGLVSESMGSKPRNVLLTKQEFQEKTQPDLHV
ncbi:DNA translocase FtsK [Bacillus taeanensis]